MNEQEEQEVLKMAEEYGLLCFTEAHRTRTIAFVERIRQEQKKKDVEIVKQYKNSVVARQIAEAILKG